MLMHQSYFKEEMHQRLITCGFVGLNFFYLLICSRYLVPRDMSMGHFIHILSSRLHLEPGKALFVFVNNTLPQTGMFLISFIVMNKPQFN